MTNETNSIPYESRNSAEGTARGVDPRYALMVLPRAEQHECHCGDDAPCKKTGICACKYALNGGQKK